MKIEHSIDIDAPAHVVWALTADVERWPSLTPTVTSVECLERGPLAVGATARIKQPGQRPAVWTVSVFEPNRRFVWNTRSSGIRMEASHVITETAHGCTNALTITTSGLLAGLLGRLAAGRIRQVLMTENEAFKREAERQAATVA